MNLLKVIGFQLVKDGEEEVFKQTASVSHLKGVKIDLQGAFIDFSNKISK